MADVDAFSKYFGVPSANLPDNLDTIADPKQFLFNLVRTKCRRKKFLDMLPLAGQHVGINYNPVLVDFVTNHWSPFLAAQHSPSLARTLLRINERLKPR